MKNKLLYSSLAIVLLMFIMLALPSVRAISFGSGVTPIINTEEFAPRVWMCDSRVVLDDFTEPGRVTPGNTVLLERINNYAFEGEKVQWSVLVMDKNGINKVQDVFVTLGPSQGSGNEIEANCIEDPSHNFTTNQTLITCSASEILTGGVNLACTVNGVTSPVVSANAAGLVNISANGIVITANVTSGTTVSFFTTIGGVSGTCTVEGLINNTSSGTCSFTIIDGLTSVSGIFPGAPIDPACNARIDEEYITAFNPNSMRYYLCTLTVETPESMYGEYWITVEAVDLSGVSGTMDENEYWFFNPVIALSIDGSMNFDDVRPGSDAYSSTMLVGNDADDSSGVLMDMFISGTDFYDSSSSGAMCPVTNQLSLTNFRYFATSGAYSTQNDVGIGRTSIPPAIQPARDVDSEGYVNIGYGVGFNNPSPFYNGFEIIQSYPGAVANSEIPSPLVYYPGNILAPGAEMAVTFKLSLPEPCNGDFDSGNIYFWGEAI